jgi:hypothetical protein
MDIALEAPGDPKGVGQGVFFIQEPLDLRLNIPRISSGALSPSWPYLA